MDWRSTTGLRVPRSGQRSIWSALPKDTLGWVLDEADVAQRLTTMIRTPIDLPEEAGFALGVEAGFDVTEDRIGNTPRSHAIFNLSKGSVQVTADDATATADLAQRAPAVARELTAWLLAQFRSSDRHHPDRSSRSRRWGLFEESS
jgi:hypothetical protein